MKHQTLYAYLNIDNPIVAWEVAIGRIRSACDLGLDQHNFGISLWQYNLLKKYTEQGLSNRFANELKLELIRKQRFEGCVSRLRGVYFFDSEEDAHAAVERWGIPNKRKFIAPVTFSEKNATRVDSEWITSFLGSEETDWMEKYWSGETLGSRPLTEVLASGIGFVQNLPLRREAYQRVIDRFPESTPLLAIACCGFHYSSIDSIAQIVPAAIREDDRVKVDFYIYMADLDTRQRELMDAIEACSKSGELPPAIRPADPDAFFRLPDLTKGGFSFVNPSIVSMCGEIHESIKT
jgi:hypothetical protein